MQGVEFVSRMSNEIAAYMYDYVGCAISDCA